MRGRESGFSYVVAMFLVAVLAVMALRGLQITLTKERREKEAQLLDIGRAYQNAIRDYYEFSPGSEKKYPPKLASLLLDERTSTTRRHLRRQYRDPMTGQSDWGLVKSGDGRIVGVFSLSTRKPLKVGGFSSEMASAKDATTYSDWKFSYLPEVKVNTGEK
jgi:type II secretory pathway pseudopilin PulG